MKPKIICHIMSYAKTEKNAVKFWEKHISRKNGTSYRK